MDNSKHEQNHQLNKQPKRSGRFSAEEKAEIVRQVEMGRTRAEVARQYGLHPNTIARWVTLRGSANAQGDLSKEAGLAPQSTRPHHSPSPVSEQQSELVLELKRKHPEMGPAQLRNQLRRFHAVSLSHKTIGKILRDAGFQLEKRVRDSEEQSVQRFEMTRPNELWTMDIKSFYVHDLKLYLIDVVDDYSRFVVAHKLLDKTSSEEVISVIRCGMQAHGKPERILTDRGTEFHSWQGISAFTKFLESESIEQSLSRPHHPQTAGKIEAVHRTLEKELIGVKRFDSFAHARQELLSYFEHYNHERTHMGIGGVTPADRYFGRINKVLADIERKSCGIDRGEDVQRLPGERAVVLQLVISNGQLELWFAGKRIVLG